MTEFGSTVSISQGLSSTEAEERLKAYGRNELVGKPPKSDWSFILAQFKNPLVLVLVVASLITLWLGDVSDATVIGVAILVNTILGFIQERKAYKSLEALKKVLAPEAWVIRHGRKMQIDARELVPGDVVSLYEGDKIPADGTIYGSEELLINEAILTGESVPVKKLKIDTEKPQSEAENNVFMGTIVSGGSGIMLVTATGMNTEMGKIALGVDAAQEDTTPLEKRLAYLARWLTIVVIVAALFVFVYGLLSGREILEMFEISVALAVAAIPEGLVVALTAILAIGMQRILKRKAVVRKLVAAETLGTVTCVCVDKTGTLTEGKMQVVETKFVDDQLGYVVSVMANDLRDANELARAAWAEELVKNSEGSRQSVDDILQLHPRDEGIPFSSERRMLAVRSGNMIFISGAPEVVLNLEILDSGNKAQRSTHDEWKDVIRDWGNRGRRIIGLGYAMLKSDQDAIELMARFRKGNFDVTQLKFEVLQFVGLMAFEDPVRMSVKSAMEKARLAGIAVKVITGDFRETAVAVMKQIGLEVSPQQVAEGSDLEKWSEEELRQRVDTVTLFARTRPAQKMQIVQALKARGHVIGMMGDGVNDAPALAAADIGMVVGEASEVAKEAADIVLLDSNFETILAAVEEGRGIFDNLRKVIAYLLTDIFSELVILIGSLLLHWPLAIGATQILWINMVGDGLPSLALTIDPKPSDLLERKPVSPKMHLVDAHMRTLIGLISGLSGLSCLAIFYWLWPLYGEEFARSAVYLSLGLSTLVYVFSCRSLRKGILNEPIWKNIWLVWSVLAGIGLLWAGMYIPVFSTMLELVPLPSEMWLIAGGVSLFVLLAVELAKLLWRHSE